MTRDIKQSWVFPHAPEFVWDFLTKPELIEQWLMKNDFQPTVGHKFQFKTKPLPAFGFDGIVNCEVLEVKPYSKLSYSWKGGSKGKVDLDTIVVWTLIPKDGGTELILEHKGFKLLKNLMAYWAMGKGWQVKIKKKIGALLDNYKK